MIVTRKNKKNVVMLAEQSYNSLVKNIYVMGHKENYDWLMKGKSKLENGQCSTRKLVEE